MVLASRRRNEIISKARRIKISTLISRSAQHIRRGISRGRWYGVQRAWREWAVRLSELQYSEEEHAIPPFADYEENKILKILEYVR